MALSKELKQVVEAAYSGMTISDDWTQAQQKDLIKKSEMILEELMRDGETPRDALERIFALYTPKNDPGRGGWFMSRATPKAGALGVDLDEKQDAESLLKRLEHGATSMFSSSSPDDTSEPKDKPKHKSDRQPKAAPPID